MPKLRNYIRETRIMSDEDREGFCRRTGISPARLELVESMTVCPSPLLVRRIVREGFVSPYEESAFMRTYRFSAARIALFSLLCAAILSVAVAFHMAYFGYENRQGMYICYSAVLGGLFVFPLVFMFSARSPYERLIMNKIGFVFMLPVFHALFSLATVYEHGMTPGFVTIGLTLPASAAALLGIYVITKEILRGWLFGALNRGRRKKTLTGAVAYTAVFLLFNVAAAFDRVAAGYPEAVFVMYMVVSGLGALSVLYYFAAYVPRRGKKGGRAGNPPERPRGYG